MIIEVGEQFLCVEYGKNSNATFLQEKTRRCV